MKRRAFIAALGCAAAWPLATRGRQVEKFQLSGCFGTLEIEEEEANYLAALRKGLADLGYVEGQNIILVNRFAAENYARFNELAKELVV